MRARSRRSAVRRAVLVLALAGLVWLVWQWFWGESWRVKEIAVVGSSSLPTEAVIAASGLYGKHFLQVDPQRAAEAVRSLRGVTYAEVQCTWEWRVWCRIKVYLSEPLALIEGARGKVWSDREGNIHAVGAEMPEVKLRLNAEAEALPEPGSQLGRALVRALNELADLPPEDGFYAYSSRYGLVWVTGEGWRVRLGKAEYDGAMRDKLALAAQIRQRLRDRGESPTVIDVRFVEAPYFVR